MSTVAPPRPDAAAAERPTDDPGDTSRWAQWRSTWAVALRMARRDVRRHKGRSALVVVMVLFPTMLLSAAVTVANTQQVTGLEAIPWTMGSGQALLEGPDGSPVVQGPDPSGSLAYLSAGEQTAEPIPGLEPGAGTFANAEAVSRLVGAPVAPSVRFSVRTTVDDRRVSLEALALDGRLGLGEKLALRSGRWPQPPTTDTDTPVEALVTPHALSRGLPSSGTVQVSSDGTTRTLEIVGVAEARVRYADVGLVTAGGLAPDVAAFGSWIVLGDDPVTWDDVRRLNEHGFAVTSRAVLTEPPATGTLDPQVREMMSGDIRRTALLVGLAGTMLLLSTTLLVGPAFAVSAARQRRTLALAASNGASTPVLRRTVLAQALVLGAATAVSGVALGVLLAYGIVTWTRSTDDPTLDGPLDVHLLTLLAVAAAATASTMVAALVPARRLGRLDIVGVMRGQSVSPRPSMAVLALGTVMTLGGTALTLGATGVVGRLGGADDGSTLVVMGAVVLVVGSLLLVPMVLAGIGRLGSRMPTALRMAARDLARHRARSAPSVAAVLAVVSGLTFGLTGLASDTEQARQNYQPRTLPGEVVVSTWMSDRWDENDRFGTDTVRRAAPGLVVTANPMFVGDPMMTGSQPEGAYRAEFVSIVPDGCSVEATVAWVSSQQPDERCAVAGSQSVNGTQVAVLPADELLRRLDVPADDAERIRAGAAVSTALPAGTARLAIGDYAVDPTSATETDPDIRATRELTVPVVHLPETRETTGRLFGGTLAFAADTPTTTGWPTQATTWTVRTEDGSPVADETVEKLQQTLGDETSVEREDGFSRADGLVVAILLTVFGVLILVVALTSTALTLAEQQTDQATLAALGATRGTRRVMASAQAFLLTAVGCALGVAVGLVPGVAIARVLTSQVWDPTTGSDTVSGDGILVIPWMSLLVVGVLVPLVAAALAAAGIRRAPQVTRRAT
ncbi:hypothetical protein JQN72_14195 [Phycicoccus sp. CSK15P-2]|uniref:FtsX-like permease family protein n=1 Tax=Phycicoccus sp. CSK15P-2 TaxID=2807627 RepID=UPI0019523DD8|nr:FtsX-like permease family protein [Phycicoccus sp. CSK15P-2]MBM6405393.1 hypothetical protein [Phycicoccus sp. CSK15P-2]